jgi:hypothetical protein
MVTVAVALAGSVLTATGGGQDAGAAQHTVNLHCLLLDIRADIIHSVAQKIAGRGKQ